jgi:hypothetical protein
MHRSFSWLSLDDIRRYPELQDVMHGSEGRWKRFSYGVLLEKESDFSIGGKPPEDFPWECVHPVLDGNDL